MPRLIFLIFLISLNNACQSTTAISEPKLKDFAENIGVQIRDLSSNKILFEHNAQKAFTPASTLKIFTFATALAKLKPSFKYETQVFYYKQNLYLKGSGDPSFSVHELDDLAGRIKQLIKTPIKNIIIDSSVFDKNYYPEDWLEEDYHRGYSAPISGLSVNFNRIVVALLPGRKILIDPLTKYVKLQKISKTKYKLTGPGINLSDTIPNYSEPTYKTYAIRDPDQWAGFLFKEALSRVNIKILGKIKSAKTPDNLTPITSSYSKYLSEQIINYLKFSNNMATESILKTLGSGSFEEGLKIVRDFTGNLEIKDASGLSRKNQITANQLTSFLVKTSKDFLIAPELLTALPIAGEDGTLENGFSKWPFKGNMRAKTGSMSGVKSFAGYFKKANGNILAFTLIGNNLNGNPKDFSQWFQSLLIKL